MRIVFISIYTLLISLHAQDLPCSNSTYFTLEKLIGTWSVKTKDRLKPGVYETNSGISILKPIIEGCAIQESFSGTFKGQLYLREVILISKNNGNIEMVALDSSHGSPSHLKGSFINNEIHVIWYRNKDIKKLQSKYILKDIDDNQFEFSSFLSTDYGVTWSLTHERKYTRKSK